MPLVSSEAIVLRARALGEADQLVSFLTRDQGRLRGVAPNARRSQRRFGAALQALSHVRLWFYERAHQELVRLSESDLIEAFWDARGEYERTLALSQVVELAERLLPEREPVEKSFRLLLGTLRAFKVHDSVWLPLTYFQLWSVRLAGWLPSLERCGRCRSLLESEPAYVSPAREQLCCRKCRHPEMALLNEADRKAALEMLSQPLARLSAQGWDRQRGAELRRYLLDVVEYHSERKLTTRELMHEKA
ncbi:MAG: DNA repair protein RecO [Terriglobia bacterium]